MDKCEILIFDEDFQNLTKCDKLCEKYYSECEFHKGGTWKAESEVKNSKLINKIKNYTTKDYDLAVVHVCQKNYDELEKTLKKYDSHEPIHDIVARIAIKLKDEKAFKLTVHHPRKMMAEFASSPDFQFLMNFYFIGDHQCYDIPSYVWKNCSLPNVIFLSEKGIHPELNYCSREVQMFFNYDEIYTLRMQCAKHNVEELNNPMESPKNIMQNLEAFIFDHASHCISCKPCLSIRKYDGEWISLDEHFLYEIIYKGQKYRYADFRALQKKCDCGDVCEICECDSDYIDHKEMVWETCNSGYHETEHTIKENELEMTFKNEDYFMTITFKCKIPF